MTTETIIDSDIVEIHELGLGVAITAVYTYMPPTAEPVSGYDWPDNVDYPGVGVEVRIPRRCIDTLWAAAVMGRSVSITWGNDHEDYSYRSQVFRAPTMASAYAQARECAEVALKAAREHVGKRAARIAKREATIQRALETCPEVP